MANGIILLIKRCCHHRAQPSTQRRSHHPAAMTHANAAPSLCQPKSKGFCFIKLTFALNFTLKRKLIARKPSSYLSVCLSVDVKPTPAYQHWLSAPLNLEVCLLSGMQWLLLLHSVFFPLAFCDFVCILSICYSQMSHIALAAMLNHRHRQLPSAAEH